MFSIYLIRHGMTQANEKRLYCGKTDLPLSLKGTEELHRIRNSGCWPDITGKKLYCSEMLRARQTAAILFPGAEIITEPGFNEMDFGDFEMRKYDGDLEYDADYTAWVKGGYGIIPCPHGESAADMKKRVVAAFEKVAGCGGDAVIVCHGGPVVAVYEHCFPGSGLSHYQMQPSHGGGYRLDYENGIIIRCTRCG